jgi:hypothetical protein
LTAEELTMARVRATPCRQLSTAGKDVELVEGAHDWYDAEEWHQHFYGGFKDLPDEI